MKQLTIVKIGGSLLENLETSKYFLDTFAAIQGPKILVHGGGNQANLLCEKLGIIPQKIDGRRVTDASTLEVVVMVYAGLLNKQLVGALQTRKVNAIGLCGVDAGCIMATKRPVQPIDYGWVGDITSVNDQAIQQFLDSGLTPIFSAITADTQGQLLNTNADTIASELAIAMTKYFRVSLYYCFDLPGVLANKNDLGSQFQLINFQLFNKMKVDKIINHGMIPKMDTAFRALQSSVPEVRIGNIDGLNEQHLQKPTTLNL